MKTAALVFGLQVTLASANLHAAGHCPSGYHKIYPHTKSNWVVGCQRNQPKLRQSLLKSGATSDLSQMIHSCSDLGNGVYPTGDSTLDIVKCGVPCCWLDEFDALNTAQNACTSTDCADSVQATIGHASANKCGTNNMQKFGDMGACTDIETPQLWQNTPSA